MIAVRDVVSNKALAAGAGQWLHDLPALVADLERDWSISVGRVELLAGDPHGRASATRIGLQPVGFQMLAAADQIRERPPLCRGRRRGGAGR